MVDVCIFYFNKGTIEIKRILVNSYSLRILDDTNNKTMLLFLTKTEKERLIEVLQKV
jgi:hypothetical protein